MSEDRLNLTGLWHGTFSYPHLMPPNGFLAELREFNGAVTGEISERSDASRDKGQTKLALVNGSRTGSNVVFVKRYDDLRRAQTPVHYTGVVNGSGDEITAAWEIPGHWAGTFIMVRGARKVAEAEARISEVVR